MSGIDERRLACVWSVVAVRFGAVAALVVGAGDAAGALLAPRERAEELCAIGVAPPTAWSRWYHRMHDHELDRCRRLAARRCTAEL